MIPQHSFQFKTQLQNQKYKILRSTQKRISKHQTFLKEQRRNESIRNKIEMVNYATKK